VLHGKLLCRYIILSRYCVNHKRLWESTHTTRVFAVVSRNAIFDFSHGRNITLMYIFVSSTVYAFFANCMCQWSLHNIHYYYCTYIICIVYFIYKYICGVMLFQIQLQNNKYRMFMLLLLNCVWCTLYTHCITYLPTCWLYTQTYSTYSEVVFKDIVRGYRKNLITKLHVICTIANWWFPYSSRKMLNHI
jgi:hypothetical protein